MNLTARTEAVVRVYRRLDLHLRTFQSLSGLACPAGCGECCLSDSAEATILELLPAAGLLEAEGNLLSTLELLRSDQAPERCLFYGPEAQGPQGGHCRLYSRRPLMCRLFGFAARLDRNGGRQLVTCRRILRHSPEGARAARDGVAAGSLAIPVMGNYAMEIFSIDPSLGTRLYPINEALVQALEIMGFDSRRRRKAG